MVRKERKKLLKEVVLYLLRIMWSIYEITQLKVTVISVCQSRSMLINRKSMRRNTETCLMLLLMPHFWTSFNPNFRFQLGLTLHFRLHAIMQYKEGKAILRPFDNVCSLIHLTYTLVFIKPPVQNFCCNMCLILIYLAFIKYSQFTVLNQIQ